MKIDFHFHLEEGSYSLAWLNRTGLALERTSRNHSNHTERNSRSWIEHITRSLARRMKEGCYSEDWVTRYLEQGRKKGIQKFGVVDHLYRFYEFKAYYEQFMVLDDSPLGRIQREWLDLVCTNSIDDYLSGMRNAARFYDELSIGVEADYFPGSKDTLKALLQPYQLDYIIGSVHCHNGLRFNHLDPQSPFTNEDPSTLYRQYYQTVIEAIHSGIFQFMAHLDHIKVFNNRPPEDELLVHYHEIAAALNVTQVATEINTGLVYQHPNMEICPSASFLTILKDYDVAITLSSDAHFPDEIGTMLDEAIQLAIEIGFKEIVYFKNKQRLTLPLNSSTDIPLISLAQ
ncbi:PHP domain-containing protein [Paenibacillus crassostreae]|uniref:Histidinol-phosphatase n=1 Tax=Paenibacillus crassostreae TaxID=1763538 RepID=A0A167GM08_9BACL|nr:PHP domain-containing protein [Paenibacillus crassostreae]AOZ92238.1 histidinol-phosphatase [Paenibacillus crassostreae]OAB77701.1 histidinol-phosphatase [Paenibacillus crassostreae]